MVTLKANVNIMSGELIKHSFIGKREKKQRIENVSPIFLLFQKHPSAEEGHISAESAGRISSLASYQFFPSIVCKDIFQRIELGYQYDFISSQVC